MARYVALLRAINVGGTGKLSMADLRQLCLDAGLTEVQTYIASGNVVFSSPARATDIRSRLEQRLAAHLGKPVGVLLRTASEIRAVLAANPFAKRAANLTYAFFLAEPPPADVIEGARNRTDEDIRPGKREIYVHYPAGMGRSRLQIPATRSGTARNMNTVAKLAAMSS